ncbi:MAG: Bug family tripartite tricarboxylate transporter substrate binding protein [Lautropia sp.]
MKRRSFLAFTAACAIAAPAAAQDYRGTLRILVGYPPGGTIDNAARILAEKLKDELGQTVIVENRPGAGGQIAMTALKSSPADGSTVALINDHQAAIIPLTMQTPGYDPARDLTPIGLVADFEASFAVHPRTGVKTFAEYVAWVKANPGDSNVGIPAPASIPEFMVGLIGQSAGVPLNPVPYRGGAAMVQDLVGGQVTAGISTPGELMQYYETGKVRVIAVAGKARSPFLPGVPTFKESGIAGLDDGSFLGLVGPANQPAATVQRYNRALNKALAMPDVQARFRVLTMLAAPSAPEELATRTREFGKHWAGVIKASGFTPK